MTVLTVTGSVIIYLGVFVLWRDGCPLWETFIMFPMGISMGIIFSSQFISMTCSSPKPRLAVCIGTYFVWQQLGILLGPAIGLALVQALFGASLGRDLPESGDKAEVSLSLFPQCARRDPFNLSLLNCCMTELTSGDHQLISNILDDVKYARSLPQGLQEIVHSSFLFGFQFVPREFLFTVVGHDEFAVASNCTIVLSATCTIVILVIILLLREEKIT